jgi:NAD(P)-dependent dehydrogenase (short-subunit alcohol dehydrogenase family)
MRCAQMSPTELAGRVAVVTGGASGIGRATVTRFLQAGAQVVFGDLNVANGQALVDEVGDDSRVRFMRTDVCEEAEVAGLVAASVDAFGRLDIVFNNAGVGGAFGPVTDIDVDDWDRTFAVITRGAFLGTKHGARAMIGLGNGGSIINDASVAGLVGGGGPTAYSAAKAAVVNFTYNSAVELARDRIRVNAICPGLIDTPMVMGKDPAAIVDRLATFQPWPDLGRPDHVASVALFLAGPDSEFLTGEAIRVDGGMMAWGPRMEGAHDQRGATRASSGFSYGSTGRPAIKHPRPDQAGPSDAR